MDRLIYLSALLFGAGVLGLLPFQSHRRIRPGFFQLVSALGFLAVLLALRFAPRGFPPLKIAAAPAAMAAPESAALLASPAASAMLASVPIFALLLVALAYAGLLWTHRLERAATVAWGLVPAAIAVAALAAWRLPLASGTRALPVVSLLTGAGLLGSVTLALLLGHWYLYSPGLPVSHLRRLTRFVIVFVAARFVVFAVAMPGYARATPAAAGAGLGAEAILASSLPLVAMRLLLGILIPGVLAWMIDRTVRIRSTQAATGLLYVAFIFVLFGELTAAYLVLTTGLPA